MFRNKSQVTIYGNKSEHIKDFCWVCRFGQNLPLFFLYFPHPLLAALIENGGGPHEAIGGVGTVAAV